jgi:hypothetical protein
MVSALGSTPRLLANEPDQPPLHAMMRAPQLAVVDREDAVPETRIIEPSTPVLSGVRVQQLHHVTRHPRREMNAVRDMANRHLIGRALGPQRPPDLARDLAMPPGDAIDVG